MCYCWPKANAREGTAQHLHAQEAGIVPCLCSAPAWPGLHAMRLPLAPVGPGSRANPEPLGVQDITIKLLPPSSAHQSTHRSTRPSPGPVNAVAGLALVCFSRACGQPCCMITARGTGLRGAACCCLESPALWLGALLPPPLQFSSLTLDPAPG